MKILSYFIFILSSFNLVAQDTTAYQLYNSAYADRNYILQINALPYKLDTAQCDSIFMINCIRKIPASLIKNMLGKESEPFKWDQKRLRNTIVTSDSIRETENILSLSAPLFDQTKNYAIVLESYDAGSCIHSGPVLLQLKGKNWTKVESRIVSYHIARINTIPRKQFLQSDTIAGRQ